SRFEECSCPSQDGATAVVFSLRIMVNKAAVSPARCCGRVENWGRALASRIPVRAGYSEKATTVCTHKAGPAVRKQSAPDPALV
ncbi:hypothetical protein PIIN_10810, partial [Serendipita indica DSM 11827]